MQTGPQRILKMPLISCYNLRMSTQKMVPVLRHAQSLGRRHHIPKEFVLKQFPFTHGIFLCRCSAVCFFACTMNRSLLQLPTSIKVYKRLKFSIGFRFPFTSMLLHLIHTTTHQQLVLFCAFYKADV